MSADLTIKDLMERNTQWSQTMQDAEPDYFKRLAQQQMPRFLWIGCADSRVPANQIIGLEPGEIFVHRNISNVVVHSDLNCLSVLQFAVDVLEVTDIIVCGHYGCGGVKAALDDSQLGLIDNWIRHIQDVYQARRDEVDSLPAAERLNKLCELNVAAQVNNVADTTIVRNAWQKGQKLAVHGWIYGLDDGLVRDLDVTRSGV